MPVRLHIQDEALVGQKAAMAAELLDVEAAVITAKVATTDAPMEIVVVTAIMVRAVVQEQAATAAGVMNLQIWAAGAEEPRAWMP